jgi:hypothetical protein
LIYNEHMFDRNAITINDQPLDRLDLVAADFYEWQPIAIACAPQRGVTSARLIVNDLDLGPPTTTLGDPLWRWQWNPQHAVGSYTGVVDLRFADGTVHREAFDLRIVPRKMDVAAYEALIAALQRDAHGIAWALSGGRVGVALGRKPDHDRTLIEEYWTLVEHHAGQALRIVRDLAARPHQTLVGQSVVADLASADRIDGRALNELLREPLDEVEADLLPALQTALRPAEQTRGGPLPRTVRGQRSRSTTDVVEHRLLVQVLQVLIWRVAVVREMIGREVRRRERNRALVEASTASLQSWAERCAVAARKLRQALATPFLEGVPALASLPSPTHLMRRDRRYRRLYEFHRDLRRTPFLALDCPAFALPIHDLPMLYEQWCLLQAVKAVLPLGEVIEQHLIEDVEDARLPAGCRRALLRLRQNQPLITIACPDGSRLNLIYQRRYTPHPKPDLLGALDPFVRVPDIAIEKTRSGEPPRVLVLDAKYRAMPDGSIPQDALDDAYAYRSAIGFGGARATLGALLLFPGSTPLHTAANVGALPLLPGRTDALETTIQQVLASH